MRDRYAHVKQAARGRWKAILEWLDVSPALLTGRHAPCPACGGKDRFRFDDKDGAGTFFCNQCGAGDGIKLVQRLTGYGYRQTMETLAGWLGQGASYRFHYVKTVSPRPEHKAVVAQRNQRAVAQIKEVLASCVPATSDTVTYTYITVTRGLHRLYTPLGTMPRDILHHPSLEYWHKSNFIGNYPAMVALVRALNGEIVNLHRTYLTEDARQAFPKGSGRNSKKWMTPIYEGATSGGAIRLFDPIDALGIAEGIETALACHLMARMPVWSALSATGMETVKIPSTVRRVIVFGDNDANGKGQGSALNLAERLQREGYTVETRIPAGAGEDWLDVFNKHTR
ncbi:MAG: toprim domain-containing protein [Candidatus Obscuribacterales bacterium]|nr:toprim domain-containing protein [Candidatus Obscuribacterales bacterium]